jgi:energy-coupling factor transporter ATP-binding protein EcfA2
VDLTLAYENRVAPAIEDVSIETEKGEFVLVAGQSNCRRSTLAL